MMESIYAGKVVLITGSSRGVGQFLVHHFLSKGAKVIGVSRGNAPENMPDDYHHLSADIADPASVQTLFSDIRKLSDKLDILVNNAAVLTSQYAMIMAPSSAQAMVNTNLLAPFLMSKEAVKIMRKNKWGRIINIGSMAASLEPQGDSVYAACKAGLATMSNVLAKEFASLNVTCNTLGITAVETDMLAQLPRDKIEAVIAGLPLPRFATHDDIFNVVDFFASERSSYITAQTVYLGGVN